MLDRIASKISAMRAAPVPVEELLETVDNLREQVAVMQAERAAVISAPRPVEEVLGAMDDWLNATSTDALDAVGFSQMLAPGAAVSLALSQSGDARTETARLLGLIVALHRPAIRKMVAIHIEQAAAVYPTAPLTEGQRATKIAELDAAILQAELSEEACIRQLEAVGIAVQRRADLNALVALADDDALPG